PSPEQELAPPHVQSLARSLGHTQLQRQKPGRGRARAYIEGEADDVSRWRRDLDASVGTQSAFCSTVGAVRDRTPTGTAIRAPAGARRRTSAGRRPAVSPADRFRRSAPPAQALRGQA